MPYCSRHDRYYYEDEECPICEHAKMNDRKTLIKLAMIVKPAADFAKTGAYAMAVRISEIARLKVLRQGK